MHLKWRETEEFIQLVSITATVIRAKKNKKNTSCVSNVKRSIFIAFCFEKRLIFSSTYSMQENIWCKFHGIRIVFSWKSQRKPPSKNLENSFPRKSSQTFFYRQKIIWKSLFRKNLFRKRLIFCDLSKEITNQIK